jgi:aryl sulfotransferase
VTDVPVLKTGAMIRKGRLGQAADDGMTPEIARDLREAGRRMCPCADALEWIYNGGPLPS